MQLGVIFHRETRYLLRMNTKLNRYLVATTLSLAFLGASVTPTAIADPASGLLARNDADHDQTLDLKEVRASASAHFDRLDKDGDHTLQNSEVKGALGAKAFKEADTDHDGTLSKDEYLSLIDKLFNKADTDNDGTLNAAELKTPAAKTLRRLIN
jgi:hypothetical protein